MTRTVQDDQHYEEDANGMMRSQWIKVEERWETLGADDKPYCREATREDAIHRHLRSNGFLAAQQASAQAHGVALHNVTEPLTAIRKVTRYAVSSVWEVESDREALDEMTEQLRLPPCMHPDDRRMWSGRYNADGPCGDGHWFCGRCCEKLP